VMIRQGLVRKRFQPYLHCIELLSKFIGRGGGI
jgi:hypothetical protein